MTMMDELFNEMEARLTKLGMSTMGDNKVDKGKVENIEKKYVISLPELYKHFLLSYEEVEFEQEIQFKTIENTPWSHGDGFESLASFFVTSDGTNKLEKKIEQYYERIPTSIFPIADDSAGNLICIGVKDDEYRGRIYFWDHENELVAKVMLDEDLKDVSSIDNYWDNVYLIAESFIDFIRSLEMKNDSIVEDINSKIIGINMSSNFMEKMRLAREKLEAKEKRKK
ncbi:hypothetical protein ASD24_05545 [Paenibacillus sp. Root52]|uniref:SMI1/KNR4 family protein n=1 Tax=Paenibacillus sp. Root52 TaxID=1736552 RepID=UPI0006F9D780|nr:SMI1/KNR4 family protein [Paenibacillus sp. Root52]KQY87325.1 hypothetical protein ASD24_05545 [Paenibacillus sp. Root52]